MKARLAEALGAFAFVFLGCGAIAVGAQTGALGHPAIALAFGLVIAVMVYALGHISGAHFNPAVSVGFAVGRHFPWSRVATYSVAQVAGATLGALALRVTLGADADLGVTQPSGGELQALAWEALLTSAPAGDPGDRPSTQTPGVPAERTSPRVRYRLSP